MPAMNACLAALERPPGAGWLSLFPAVWLVASAGNTDGTGAAAAGGRDGGFVGGATDGGAPPSTGGVPAPVAAVVGAPGAPDEGGPEAADPLEGGIVVGFDTTVGFGNGG